MMNLLRSLYVVFLVALFPQFASANAPDPCSAAGQAQALPLAPSSNDPIGIVLSVATTFDVLFPHPAYQYYWFKQTVASGNTFVFDVILTNDRTTFPGYTLVGKEDQNWGFIGPLPAGSYTLLGTVNVYDPSTGTISPQCDPAMFGPAQKVVDLTVWSPDDPVFQRGLRSPEAPLVEFYSPSRDDYFMTMDGKELLIVANTPDWVRTGEQFFAYATGTYYSFFDNARGSVSRYYGLLSAGLNTHLYLFSSSAEAASLSPSVWVPESNERFAMWQPLTSTGFCPPHTLPVYRLWNGRSDAHHRWTINPDIRQQMIEKGWVPEGYGPYGVVMCSPTI